MPTALYVLPTDRRAHPSSRAVQKVSLSPPLYAAPRGSEPFRAALPGLPSPQGRPRLAGVALYTPLARQRTNVFPSY